MHDVKKGYKHCGKCHSDLLKKMFGKNCSTKDGLHQVCRSCNNAASKASRIKTKKK